LDAAIDSALRAMSSSPKLIVDLRSNPGGDIHLALRFRDRFLDDGPTTVGHIRRSLPEGGLSAPETLIARPDPGRVRWTQPVVFLLDELTYSASEDALMGLRGRTNVRFAGAPSGGGSGRMRVMPFLPGYKLSVTTAHTFDHLGHRIEGNGHPVDRVLDYAAFVGDDEGLLKLVASQWP
jgi:C-terminal processing protease CtpA/Prc